LDITVSKSHLSFARAAFALCVALSMTACAASSTTPLPELKRPEADRLLTPAQQQQAIQDLARKKTDEEAAAMKKIQQSR
jgi:hypothetical protein